MKKTVAGMGLLLFLLAGCAAVKVESTGRDIEQEPSKIIKSGITTREEVINMYGEPSTVTTKDGLEELVYESRKVETPTFLGGLVINDAGKDVNAKRLEITIKDGVVQSYKYEAKGGEEQ
jgi:outer membrane protein assembly factor BamE (lipoprotein component of BamABCDE complex)